MPKGNNELLQNYFIGTLVYTATDVTTNIVRRMAALTGDATKKLKAMIVSAGGSN